jgi:biotin carboxyl carrier protein
VAEVRPLGEGRFLLVDGSGQRIAYAVTAGARRWVFLDGRTYVVAPHETGGRERAARGHGASDEQALAAPMPATVSAIRVKAGDPVAAGDVLVMLEAMKMELPVKAPRDGRVAAINCREGELVQPGIPLVELA